MALAKQRLCQRNHAGLFAARLQKIHWLHLCRSLLWVKFFSWKFTCRGGGSRKMPDFRATFFKPRETATAPHDILGQGRRYHRAVCIS